MTSAVTFQAQFSRGQWPIAADRSEITADIIIYLCSIWEQRNNSDTEAAGQGKMKSKHPAWEEKQAAGWWQGDTDYGAGDGAKKKKKRLQETSQMRVK